MLQLKVSSYRLVIIVIWAVKCKVVIGTSSVIGVDGSMSPSNILSGYWWQQ